MTGFITTQAQGAQILSGGDAPIAVPSGQQVTLQDVIWNSPGPSGVVVRFRFVAAAIAPDGGVDFETAAADMQHLCEVYALPKVTGSQPAPQQIVISLSAQPVPFGEASPGVTQFFEAYRLQDNACIWEAF